MSNDLSRRQFNAAVGALGLVAAATPHLAFAGEAAPVPRHMPGTAMLLIDVQKDYFPNGKFPLVGMDAAAGHCADLLGACRANGIPPIHVRHEELAADATFFLPGTEGAEINPIVAPRAGETVITKHFPNAFLETGLKAHLDGAGIKSLIIVGAMTFMCVDATTRAAADLGYKCTVVHDACAARALSFGGEDIPAGHVHGAFLAALGMGYAEIKAAADVLGAIAKA